MFSRSSSCFAWAAWQLQFRPTACGTLRKRVTKPFPQPAALDCIVWGRLYNFLTDETIQQIPKLARLTLQPFY